MATLQSRKQELNQYSSNKRRTIKNENLGAIVCWCIYTTLCDLMCDMMRGFV